MQRVERIIEHLVPVMVAGGSEAEQCVNESTFYDVIVVGGGVAGAATCDELSRRNLKVLLLEQFNMAHARGRHAYAEEVYCKMAAGSYSGWLDLQHRSGESLFRPAGGYDIAPKGHPLLNLLKQTYTLLNIPFEELTGPELTKRAPMLSFSKEYGVLEASRCVGALWKVARAQGAVMLPSSKVQDIVVQGPQRVLITLDNGKKYSGKSVVITAGPYMKNLLSTCTLNLKLPVTLSQETVMYFAPKLESPVKHSAGNMPITIVHGDVSLYSIPSMDVPGVKIGTHYSSTPVLEDADTRKPIKKRQLRQVKAFVQEHMPHLQLDPIYLSTCLYTNTEDHHFILDYHPKYKNVVIGSPCSGHGFKFGPVLGKMLTALVLHEEVPYYAKVFKLDADRSQKRPGA